MVLHGLVALLSVDLEHTLRHLNWIDCLKHHAVTLVSIFFECHRDRLPPESKLLSILIDMWILFGSVVLTVRLFRILERILIIGTLPAFARILELLGAMKHILHVVPTTVSHLRVWLWLTLVELLLIKLVFKKLILASETP